MMLLAQITAEQNGQWISSFQFYLLLVLNVVALGKLFMPQRRSVSFEGVPVDKAEFDKHLVANRAEHENLFAKLGGVERGMRAEIKADTLRIEEKVNGLGQKASALESSLEAQDQKLAHMDAKLDRLIERKGT